MILHYINRWWGCLRYLCNTRPGISYSVGPVSQFMDKPHHTHILVVKRILRYLKRTIDQELLYLDHRSCKTKEVVGFIDSDWFADPEDRRSNLGYLFKFKNTCISWNSKKQSIIALSSCEAKYVVASTRAY